jgi:methyl-accepting chemotaxis protein
MAEISTASSEQARGISQVNQTVTQLDSVTQQNAQLVQRSVSVAGGLRREAERLGAAVKAFIIAKETRNEPQLPPPPVALPGGARRAGSRLRVRAGA